MSISYLALVSLSFPQMVAVSWEMSASEEPMPEVREAPGTDGVLPSTASVRWMVPAPSQVIMPGIHIGAW
jgi:hypothetical protein